VGTTVWAAGFLAEVLFLPLARYTFNAVSWALSVVYAETVNDAASLRVGTPAFSVIVSPQCSGYEGVGLIVAFLSVYLWLSRKDLRFPHALILLPLGAVTIWLANAIRIVVLIAIGAAGWQAVALGGFHSQAGWIAFNTIALGFVFLTNRFGFFMTTAGSASAPRESAGDEGDATMAYLGPFIAITATAMLTGAMAAGFDWLYPVRVVAAAAVLWAYRKHYAHPRWSYSWWSFAIGFVTFVIWIALTPADSHRNAGWPAAMESIPLHWAAAWMLFRIIGYVITVPLAEELAFRGFLTRRLQHADFQSLPAGAFSWPSFVISSVLFGAFHGSLWLPGTIAGMLFALALYRRRSLGDAVWAHATTNALLAVYASATGRWWVWS
jgi:exosortase E/protease (VPEID-CTERM system)